MVTQGTPTRRLAGKVALVVGASRGIGASSALRLADEGAAVVLASRDRDAITALADVIRERGGRAEAIHTDAASVTDVDRAVAVAVQTFGQLDIAFNNAGVQGPAVPLHQQTLESWDQLHDINLRGTFICMRAEAQAIQRSRSGGSIINNASVGGLIAAPGIGPYCASKHGVIGLTKSAALDYAADDIRVNALAPGAVDTEMFNQWMHDPEARAEMQRLHPLGRIAGADEIAGTVAWLASEDSSFVTGTVITIDGGYTAA